MQNAIRYNERITLGIVPSAEDLHQLSELGYKTIIDLREINEKFGGFVERRARGLGFNYINIPINRDSINTEDVNTFFKEVFARGRAPLYIFSRYGKKPLVFLLIFDAVAQNHSVIRIYQQAARMGYRLEGDITLQKFLYSLYNSDEFKKFVNEIRESRTDIFNENYNAFIVPEKAMDMHTVTISEMLMSISNAWNRKNDKKLLIQSLESLIESVEENSELH